MGNAAVSTRCESASPVQLFPEQEPFDSGYLQVDPLHRMYWQQTGNPHGTPILVVHGGPGAAGSPVLVQMYDPDVFRIVCFHQRGAGRSTPPGEVQRNSTWHLVSDMEKLRLHLEIDRWVVSGGSWGSTLSLAYAQSHPERCLALLLAGIFLGRREDVEWFLTASRDFFPVEWEALVGHLSGEEQAAVLHSYAARIMSGDEEIREEAIRSWAAYESSIASLIPSAELKSMFQDPDLAFAYSRLNMHYFTHDCFLNDRPIMANMAAIADVPGFAIHGRYDLCTPHRSAVELVRKWPAGELVTVDDAGHSRFSGSLLAAMMSAAASIPALLAATDRQSS